MKHRNFSLTAIGVLTGASLLAQTAAPPAASPKTAQPAKAAARPAPAAAVNPAVQQVIEMVKSGMSEAFIVKKLAKDNKPVDLSAPDMVKLKQAGVSENIMNAMMDPAAGSAAAAAPAPSPVAAAPAPVVAPATPVSAAPPPAVSASFVPAASRTPPPSAQSQKKRVIVDPFDYSAVMTAVQAIFGSQQNIGKGIQAMLVTRVARDGKLVVVDRAKLAQVTQEQDFNQSNRVKQGTGARIGAISAADLILAGDIVIFGRDDKHKGGAAAAATAFCRFCGALAAGSKTDKAVVTIEYKLIDAETTEVVASGEAKGESQRSGFNMGAMAGAYWRGAGAASVDMTSSNFAETIIGEATQDAVNKLAAILADQSGQIKKAAREVEGLVLDATPDMVTVNVGANAGVNSGDVFEILRPDRELKDPVTHEVLDRITTKVGEMTVNNVRDKVAMGSYIGSLAQPNYVARKKMPAGN